MAVPKRKTSKARRDKRRAHARHRGAARERVPDVPPAEAAAPRLPDLRDVQGPRGRAAPPAGPVRPVRMIRVAVDALGGDRAPDEVVAGALDAASDEVVPILFGPAGLDTHGLELVEAPDRVEMDEKPSDVVRGKPRSSLVAAVRAVGEGKADAVVSAGNTGAMLAAALVALRRIPGVRRPAIAVPIPTRRGPSVLIDGGANADARPEHLLQFGHMGAVFAEEVLGVARPTVRLLSIGEEPEKGNELTPGRARAARGERPQVHRQHRGAGAAPRCGRRRRRRRLHGQHRAEAARGHDLGAPRRAARGDHGDRARQAGRAPDPARGAPPPAAARPGHLRRRLPARRARHRRDRPRQLVAARRSATRSAWPPGAPTTTSSAGSPRVSAHPWTSRRRARRRIAAR